MVFDMILSSRGVVVFGFASQELISIGELKDNLHACLANDVAVTLRIHVARRVDRTDIRSVSTGLFVVVAYGWLKKSWLVTVDRL